MIPINPLAGVETKLSSWFSFVRLLFSSISFFSGSPSFSLFSTTQKTLRLKISHHPIYPSTQSNPLRFPHLYVCKLLRTQKPTHANTYTRKHLRILTPTHALTYACTHLRTQTSMHANIYARKDLRTQTPTHANAYARKRIRTPTRRFLPSRREAPRFFYEKN